ncbi:hypothetical protein ZWY2020_038018 [Hordeum vulgare]|nr:hypothetical protein ZWY2020_038018 [Hordeum vulgare]
MLSSSRLIWLLLLFRLQKQDRSVGAEDAQRVSLAEQKAQIEMELGAKERETLDVLKQLESDKKFIAGLKLKIQKKTDEDTLQPEEDKRQTESNCSLTEVSAAEPDVKQPEEMPKLRRRANSRSEAARNAEAPEEEQTAEVKQPEEMLKLQV